MNVPISASYHEQLAAIALVDRKSMKSVVEGMIEADGRGKALVEAMKAARKVPQEPEAPTSKPADPQASPV